MRTVRAGLPLLIYVAAALAVFHTAWQDPAQRALGFGSDPPEEIWFQSYVEHALTQGWNLLLPNHMLYPAGFNMMWNTAHPLVGILLAPAGARFGPVVGYNATATLALAVSAWTAFLLLRRISGSWIGGLAGGFVYGFSPFMIAQSLGHPQMTLAFVPPLILLVLDAIVRGGRSPLLLGAAVGALAAAQLLIGEEVLMQTLLLVALVVAVAVAARPAQARVLTRRVLTAGAAALVTGALLAAWPLWIQFRGPGRPGAVIHGVNTGVTDLQNLVLPTSVQMIAPHAALAQNSSWSGNLSEWNAYLGLPMLALLVVAAVVLWRDHAARLAVAIASVFLIWSMGSSIHLGGDTGVPALLAVVLLVPFWRCRPAPVLVAFVAAGWWAFAHVPVLDNLIPNRLTDMAYLALGALLALFIAWAARRPLRDRLAAAAAVGLALIPLLPTLQYPYLEPSAPAFFTTQADLARIPEGSVLVTAPFGDPYQPAPLFWQVAAGMRYRTPGGYAITNGARPGTVTFSPPDSPLRLAVDDAAAGARPAADPARADALRAQIRDWMVRTIVVPQAPASSSETAMFTDLLGRPPLAIDGVYVWFDVNA